MEKCVDKCCNVMVCYIIEDEKWDKYYCCSGDVSCSYFPIFFFVNKSTAAPANIADAISVKNNPVFLKKTGVTNTIIPAQAAISSLNNSFARRYVSST